MRDFATPDPTPAFAPPPGVEAHDASDRAAWLKLRKADLTASEVGAVLGLDPRKSALTVWMEKTDKAPPEPDSPILRRGRIFEETALRMLEAERPDLRIFRPGLYLRRPDWRLGATPDALALDAHGRPGVIQIKVVTAESAAEEWAEDRAPARYEIQTLVEMMLFGAEWGLLAAMVLSYGGVDLITRGVLRHEAAEAVILSAAAQFAECVATRQAPAARGAADSRALDRLAGEAEAQVDLGDAPEVAPMFRRLLQLKAERKAAKAEADAIEAALKERMGNASAAVCGAFRATWRTQARAAFAVPEISTRIFRVSERRAP